MEDCTGWGKQNSHGSHIRRKAQNFSPIIGQYAGCAGSDQSALSECDVPLSAKYQAISILGLKKGPECFVRREGRRLGARVKCVS